MAVPYRAKKTGSRFGGKSAGRGFRDRGFGATESFQAVCADCGESCTVPFRPNGKKPVLCSRCFKKDEGSDFKKPWESAPTRKPWEKTFTRPGASRGGSTGGDIQAQLTSINAKLDEILRFMRRGEE